MGISRIPSVQSVNTLKHLYICIPAMNPLGLNGGDSLLRHCVTALQELKLLLVFQMCYFPAFLIGLKHNWCYLRNIPLNIILPLLLKPKLGGFISLQATSVKNGRSFRPKASLLQVGAFFGELM